MEGRVELVFWNRAEAHISAGCRVPSVGGREGGSAVDRAGGHRGGGVGAAIDRAAANRTLCMADGTDLRRVGVAAGRFCTAARTGGCDRGRYQRVSERAGGEGPSEPEHTKAGAQCAGVPLPRRVGTGGGRPEWLPGVATWAADADCAIEERV